MSLPRTSPFTYSAVLAEELEIAGGIWSSMLDRGLSPPKMLCVDLEFTSNSDESLENLATFLRKRGYELCPPRRRRLIPHECNRHIEGKTNDMRIDEDCLMVWVAEMVRLADAFHCQFGDWGAFFDPNRLLKSHDLIGAFSAKGTNSVD
jgi:regulator of RNase E activity RraB